MKINNKILFWFLVIAIVPSGITGFFGYQICQDILKKHVYNQLSTTADGVHDRIHDFIKIKKERIIDFSSDGLIANHTYRLGIDDNKDFLVADLNRHLSKNKTTLDADILETFIVNLHGEVVASSNPNHVGLKRADADYFEGAKRQDVCITDLHRCIDADEPVIEVSRLLTRRKNENLEIVGVIVNRIKGSSLAHILVKDTTGKETVFAPDSNLATYIVNRNNQVVAGSNVHNGKMLEIEINTEPINKFNETGEEIIGVYQDYLGNKVFGVSIYDYHMDWIILVEEDVDTVFADMKYLRDYVIVMKIITICIVILLAIFISRGITLPIKSLLEGTKKLGKGVSGSGIHISSRDEVGELADSFNTMADSIQERTDSLNKTKDYLRNILDNTQDMVITTDTNGCIVEFNTGAEQILGYTRKEVVGRSAEIFYLDLNKKKRLMKRIEDEGAVKNYEAKLRTKQGADIHMVITVSQLKDNSGNVIGSVEVGKDITEKNKQEEELTKTNKKLESEINERNIIEIKLKAAKDSAERANKAKSEFLANMSHEVRTPMSAIIGMTYLLLDTHLTSKQHEYADTIRESAGSLLNIINDILDFSKIEAGKLMMEVIDFELLVTMNSIIDVFTVKAEERGLGFSCFIDPEVPLLLRGDPGRLRQVLINLIGNAIKFTNDGQIDLSVTQVKKSDSHTTLRFVVRDTGIGIPVDRVNRLFQSFSQVDSSTTRKYGGTGLGLAISRQITELMGGQIGVESKEGNGSTFWFTVVLEKQSQLFDCLQIVTGKKKSIEKNSTRQIVTRYSISEERKRSVRILLAEDNITNQKVALRILEKNFGIHADVVNNGREAIETLEKLDYDMILMDCQMPEMDGYEATRIIRDGHSTVRDHNIPIVALTANAMKGDREKCLEAGMDDYVTKPINVNNLSKSIKRHLPVDFINEIKK